MGNLKRWTQVGQGEFHKWDTTGQELIGIWRGQKDGQFSPLGLMDVDGARISFPLHTALVNKVDGIKLGAEVRIVYKGKQISKGGREFKAFEVYVADPIKDLVEPAEAQTDDDPDIPF